MHEIGGWEEIQISSMIIDLSCFGFFLNRKYFLIPRLPISIIANDGRYGR